MNLTGDTVRWTPTVADTHYFTRASHRSRRRHGRNRHRTCKIVVKLF
jgi:hypothetical protein